MPLPPDPPLPELLPVVPPLALLFFCLAPDLLPVVPWPDVLPLDWLPTLPEPLEELLDPEPTVEPLRPEPELPDRLPEPLPDWVPEPVVPCEDELAPFVFVDDWACAPTATAVSRATVMTTVFIR